MSDRIDEDALLAGRASYADLCRVVADAIAAPREPDPSWRVLRAWRHVEWFWSGQKDDAGSPGEWATLRISDMSKAASAHEMKIWGGGYARFKPNFAWMSSMGANAAMRQLTPAEDERFRTLNRELDRHVPTILTRLEQLASRDAVYADPAEIAAETVSRDLVRTRRDELSLTLQAFLRTIIFCRNACPTTDDLPNRRFSQALFSGWIPVGYVGSLRSGQVVVFHPLRTGTDR